MTEHRRGQWPVTQPVDLDALTTDEAGVSTVTDTPEGVHGVDALVEQGEQYARRAAEKALHEMCLDSIRHDLEQQPTAGSVQAKARVWCAQILALAEDVAAEKRRAA